MADPELDRWIRVVAPNRREMAAPQRLSSIRDIPFVVLLGEPGIGKSTVLEEEAAFTGDPCINVAEFMADPPDRQGIGLLLDGLDEYRMDGGAIGKINGLGAKLAAIEPSRLRITCRAEDWRSGADLRALESIAGKTGIVIAHILPLDEAQILRALSTIGVDDPCTFVVEARRRGAGALLENPLCLRLLATAVRIDSQWPASRYDVFEKATTLLSYEHNDIRKERRDRTAAKEILAAADKAALVLLCTSASAIWRSAGAPPHDIDPNRLLIADDLGLDQDQLSDTLDTPLFKGTNVLFEPMHKSVAEFMAGRALARAVTGEYGAALPLSRALALIVAPDGKAPGELRGLFAWFATHLATRGAPEKARLLVERDAVSVLAYGDAAAFDAETRVLLLDNLSRDDPYFLNSEDASSAVGALAQDDMVDAFTSVLIAPATDHRLALTYQVLTAGKPLEALAPLLRSMALDPARPEWERARASEAWVNACDHEDGILRKLFLAMTAEPPSTAREALRIRLLAFSPDVEFSDDDVRDVLRSYAATSGDSTVGRLFYLQLRLQEKPRFGILDHPWSDWLPLATPLQRREEVRHLLDLMLAAAIAGEQDFGAVRLWAWCSNSRDDVFDEFGIGTTKALKGWLRDRTDRAVGLFLAILDDPAIDLGAGAAAEQFFFAAGIWPGIDVVEALIERGDRTDDVTIRRRIIEEVAKIGHHRQGSPAVFDAAWTWLDTIGDRPARNRLSMSVPGAFELKRARRQRSTAEKREQHRTEVAASYLPILGDVRTGVAVDGLAELAKPYFSFDGDEPVSGADRIAAQSDAITAEAAIEGFEHLARQPPPFSAVELGQASAEGVTFSWELAALAGVDLLLRNDPDALSDAKLELGLIALFQSGYFQDEDRRGEIERWAWALLDADPASGAVTVRECWNGALASRSKFEGPLYLYPNDPNSGACFNLALEGLLREKPDLAPDTLHHLLLQAAMRLAPSQLEELASAALGSGSLSAQARARWSVVLFALGGDSRRDLLKGHRGPTLQGLLEGKYGDGLLGVVACPDNANRAARNAAVVRMLGVKTGPESSRPTVRLLRPYQVSDAVHEALRLLESNPDPAAGRLLLECLEDAKLSKWHDAIRHARAQHLRILRDTSFIAPKPEAVLGALAGKGPVNGADLRAIVVEELRELGRSMRSGTESTWRFYWNTDKDGAATDAKIENVGRDISLRLIASGLDRYGVPIAFPEVTRGLSTRVDILIATGAGRNLPVEAKRHYHADLWTAASDQLQGYATAKGADGNGVLLVFWYGTDWTSTPTRGDKKKPKSAAELENLLVADLSPALRERTDVVVLDVSRPKGGKSLGAFARARKAAALLPAPSSKGAGSRAGSRPKAAGRSRSKKPISRQV